ncbi:hypothetical protein GGR06_003502 [Bacteroides reticulotermitis]|uniref:Uncharacterized protein n=1 Tax=Bacteroides reticulotermitis TaxID=1133319 RepID=A0A840DAS7_9BACE|nr:hypothetical protein [Bacteroides reticulotermitis]
MSSGRVSRFVKLVIATHLAMTKTFYRVEIIKNIYRLCLLLCGFYPIAWLKR